MSPDAPDAPDPEKILERLAEGLDVGRLLRDHPEWTREDVRCALETGAERISESPPAPPARVTREAPEGRLPRSIILYADGASRGNPGPAGAGVVLCDEAGDVVGEAFEHLGECTNNVAEYRALILGLETALERGARRVLFHCDSELLARQLQGRYKVRSENLKGLYAKARRLIGGLESFRAEHVYRESNALADALANQAIDEAKG